MATHSKGRRTGRRAAAVAAGYARNAQQTSDLATAAARTIGLRSALIAAAAGDPGALANPEFVRMGREKVEAALLSGGAMAASLQAISVAWTSWFVSQTARSSYAAAALTRCHTPAEAALVQMRYVDDSLAAAVTTTLRLAGAANRLAYRGLAPVERAASANAARLSRPARPRQATRS